MSIKTKRKTEIMAISSGKGGTGKTLIAACLGYALQQSGHRVLMIDGDPGTDGLSLMLLGPDGKDAISDFPIQSTLYGVLQAYAETGEIEFEPHPVNRREDHGVIYQSLISGRGIYGDRPDVPRAFEDQVVPRLEAGAYFRAVGELYAQLREQEEFDYVVVDTRGGFSYESTGLCALADSFIVVTEADDTSFYQDRNLVDRIDAVASALARNEKTASDRRIKTQPVLRGIIVNKATQGDEKDFRRELVREFRPKLKLEDTFAVPLDVRAIEAYRGQQIPYRNLPESSFSSATLRAFSRMLHFVTAAWDEERIDAWLGLTRKVQKARYGPRGLFAFLRLRALAAVAVGVMAAGWAATSFYTRSQVAAQLDLKTTLHSAELAPSVRLNNLLLLYSDGIRAFNGLDVAGLDLSRLALPDIHLRGASLSSSTLRGIDLDRAQLTRADLAGADLSDASLNGADLREADLVGASLRGANLNTADLQGADLSGADLSGVYLRGSNVTQEQLDSAYADPLNPVADLPSGLTPPLAGLADGIDYEGYDRRLADVNGDGNRDLVMIGPETAFVYLGRADGGLLYPRRGSRRRTAHLGARTELEDLDGDGVLELVYYDRAARTNYAYCGTSDGTFESKASETPDDRPWPIPFLCP